ncbi:MAG: protein kinase [Clostridiaceae bacterium]
MMNPELLCMRCMSSLHEPNGVCPRCGFDAASIKSAPHHLARGSILAGSYLVGCALGQGGFGITYVGWDLNLDVKVAIKEYYPEGLVTRDLATRASVVIISSEREAYFQKGRERFVDEARTLARFSSDKSIVGVRGFFLENGTAYIVMDFIEGETLKAYAHRKGGKLPAAEVLEMMRPLCDSLQRVHEAGLLHRDISPDNIMVRGDGSLMLLDFGAARQISIAGEHSNTINVKHGYAPEEQYRTHGQQGPWTDVYALSATIYRLVTGVTPPQALDRMSTEVPLLPPNQAGADLTRKQEQAILHGLSVHYSERTTGMEQFKSELFGSGRTDGSQIKSKSLSGAPQAAAKAGQPGSKKTAGLTPVKPNKWYLWAGLLLAAACLLIVKSIDDRKAASATPAATAAQTSPAQAATAEPTPTPFAVSAAPKMNYRSYPLDIPVRASAAQQQAQYEAAVQLIQSGSWALVPSAYDFSKRISLDYYPQTAVLDSDGRVCLSTDVEQDREAAGKLTSAVMVSNAGEAVLHDDGTVSWLRKPNLRWSDMTAIAGADALLVGLKDDGTIRIEVMGSEGAETVDRDAYLEEWNLTEALEWTDIVSVAAGYGNIIGLASDGSVVTCGSSSFGTLDGAVFNRVFVAVSAGDCGFAGLLQDGTVETSYELCQSEVETWTDIVAISVGASHIVGLKNDGTVVAAGPDDVGENDVSDWHDIIAVSAGLSITIGVRSDGGLNIAGGNFDFETEYIRDITLW